MERTWKPTTAGILCIIAGAIGVIAGIAVASFLAFYGMGWFSAIGAPLIILGIIPIVGGIYALRRRIWGLALAGSIFTLIGFVILGILGIFLFVAGYSDQPELVPFDATTAEVLAVIWSDPLLVGFIVGCTILGVLGILAIVFVVSSKREFR